MKPCRKQYQTTAPSVQRSAAVPEANVRRYAHPIRTVKPSASVPTEEMLAGILEELSRQSDKLDEVLRRLDGDNSDTM